MVGYVEEPSLVANHMHLVFTTFEVLSFFFFFAYACKHIEPKLGFYLASN
jgi:hypothetical protein